MMVRTVIGVTGGTGVGKTQLVSRMTASFPDGSITVINQDNYYLPRERQPRDKNGIENFDTLDSIDPNRMKDDIVALLSGRAFRQRLYTFNNPQVHESWVEVKPAPIIVIEGLYSLCYSFIHELTDITVFLDAGEDIMLARRIQRDRMERGYDKKDVEYRFNNHFLPAYRQHVLPLRDKSTFVLNNEGDMEETARKLETAIRERIDFLS